MKATVPYIDGRAAHYFVAVDAEARAWLRHTFPLNEPFWGYALRISPPKLVRAVEEKFVAAGGQLLDVPDFTDTAN